MRLGTRLLAIILYLSGVALATSVVASPVRQRFRMDADWRFSLDTGDNSVLHGVSIDNWVWIADAAAPGDADKMAAPDLDTSGGGWAKVSVGTDVFHGRIGFAWYRTVLPALKIPNSRDCAALRFASVDDNATVYLNGKRLLHHEGWSDPFEVYLDKAWNPEGPNTLAVLVENTDGAGGIMGPVTLSIARKPDGASVPPQAKMDFKDHAWKVVHLPNDYVVESPFSRTADTSHGFHIVQPAWYRKTFTLPASFRGKTLALQFDGIYRDAKIWLNGRFLGEHKSGYIGVRYDITRIARIGGRNVLAVHVDPRQFEGWWYEGGGIYRHVWLDVENPLHVAHWGTFVISKVSGDVSRPGSANLTIRTTLVNKSSRTQSCVLASLVKDPCGVTVAKAVSGIRIKPGQSIETTQRTVVNRPMLWSLSKRNLYHLVSLVSCDGVLKDDYRTTFGIRTIKFDPNLGFFLNGKHVKIKGTCNHQDFAGVGIALTDHILDWRIAKLKSMGSNGYRCSHNPVATELLNACDKQGMLVMDENRHLGDTYSPKSSPNTPYSDLQDLKDMILRDRNHPSIIMWSICNEEPLQGTEIGARIAEAMKKVIDKLDGTRPVTAAMNGGHGKGMTQVLDLQGYNYDPSGYAWFHRNFPNIPLFGSETGSTVSDRGVYANDPAKGYVSAYDVNTPPWAQTAENAWRPVAEAPYVAGSFCWTGFDYRGEPTPYGWPCINSHFGIMDMCGFPKDNFYYYLAWWGKKPLVHILPHWNWQGEEGRDIDVWCYSNCDRVELFLNGKSLGAQAMPKYGHVHWEVPYEPGKLVAKGYDNGRLAATDVVETTGPAAAIKLSPDRTKFEADGENDALVTVSITDSKGRVVPTANNMVTFQVYGPARIEGVGNGDPSCHEPDKASRRSAFNGLCMVIVQSKSKPGVIRLTAHSPGLQPATILLRTVPSPVKDL